MVWFKLWLTYLILAKSLRADALPSAEITKDVLILIPFSRYKYLLYYHIQYLSLLM